jgi:hypothetical protein
MSNVNKMDISEVNAIFGRNEEVRSTKTSNIRQTTGFSCIDKILLSAQPSHKATITAVNLMNNELERINKYVKN